MLAGNWCFLDLAGDCHQIHDEENRPHVWPRTSVAITARKGRTLFQLPTNCLGN